MSDAAGSEAGALRVWWIPQVPGQAFHVSVPDIATAGLLMDALADYDAFQHKHRIKPDYCNAGGLQVFEDDDWTDWHCPLTGDDFEDYWRAARPVPA